jgi:hypothetical protein
MRVYLGIIQTIVTPLRLGAKQVNDLQRRELQRGDAGLEADDEIVAHFSLDYPADSLRHRKSRYKTGYKIVHVERGRQNIDPQDSVSSRGPSNTLTQLIDLIAGDDSYFTHSAVAVADLALEACGALLQPNIPDYSINASVVSRVPIRNACSTTSRPGLNFATVR